MTNENENQNSETEALEKVQEFIVQQMKEGADKDAIKARLEETGIDRNQATELVDTIYPEIVQAVKEQEFTTDSLLPAVIGAALAAAIGGAVWGAIVIFSGYEVGIVAWGIGFLSGAAVVFFTKGKRGTPLQVLAVVSSIAGIAIGKYITFYHYMKQIIINDYGEEAAANLSIISSSVFEFFVNNASSILGGYDILWIVLAVITAWRIPQGMGIKSPAHAHP